MVPSRFCIDESTQIRLVELFVDQVTARTAADLRNSAALYFHKLRQCIAARMGEIEPELAVFECDESYFGRARKDKRGRGAAGNVCVFGIAARAPTSSSAVAVCTHCRGRRDQPNASDSLENKGAGRLRGLHQQLGQHILDVSGFTHHRVNHSKTLVSRRGNHINGIENFWSQSRRVLRKYNGIPRKNFFLFLKEGEFRFNYESPKQQLGTLLTWVSI